MPDLNPITAALIKEQGRLKLKGPEMAAKLGINSCYYSMIINGHKQPGGKVITNAVRNFPRINVTNLLRDVKEEN